MNKPIVPINSVIQAFRKLVPEGKKIILQCSGGPDSTALLFCAHIAKLDIEVVHFLHNMRPVEIATEDKNCILAHCAKFGVKVRVCPINCPTGASENDYRELRNYWIERECYRPDKYSATAHHADDQLETLIMKISRGCGLEGLTGIAEDKILPNTGVHVVRPMLSISKEDIYDICKQNNLAFVEDQTNKDTHYSRNAIRQNVIPALKVLYPRCAEHANETAKIASKAVDLVSTKVKELSIHESSYEPPVGKGRFSLIPGIQIRVEALRLSDDIVIAAWLRKTAKFVGTSNLYAADKINKQMIDQVISAIRHHESKSFLWPTDRVISINRSNVRVYAKGISLGFQPINESSTSKLPS